MSIAIRTAIPADKDFVVTAIVAAEKSGGDKPSYCAIFGISESELREALGNMLDEEVEGQELFLPNFLLAEADGVPAAVISTWVENESGMTSSMLKSNLLMFFIEREKILTAAPLMTLVNAINIPREDGALQIECVYTAPDFRGRGLVKQLIDEAIEQAATKNIKKAQVIMLGNNSHAIRAYEKAGFSITREQRSNDDAILQILPANSKVLMERIITND